MNIDKNVTLFLEGYEKNKGRQPGERYSSFDYCFNYFQSFRDENKIADISSSQNMQLSCLQLGFYLASWGMFRPSSFLLERSVKIFVPLIKNISCFDGKIWGIDVDKYSDDNLDLLLECRKMIFKSFEKYSPSDTLITKIMLGVFGNIPAFDNFVKKAYKLYYVNKSCLKRIQDFYLSNKIKIDSYKIPTFDFLTGQNTSLLYTKAKIVDMIGFVEGQYFM